MHTTIPEKLLALADEITKQGDVSLSRLTVLKKWFARPARLPAFALWVAAQALARKGSTAGTAGVLFRECQALLGQIAPYAPHVNRKAAERLYERLRSFQDEYRQQAWGPVRVIHHWNLLLVEQALDILLWHADSPAHGYKLAADYCQHYDPSYGNGLNGPSRRKIKEMARFLQAFEAAENASSNR